MRNLLFTLAAGPLATGGMSLFMAFVSAVGLANANMIRAVGSVWTKSYDNSLKPGLAIHFAVGMVLAFVYALFISLLNPGSLLEYVVGGVVFSTLHGLVVSFVLVVMVAQYHPIEKFQQAGSEVAVAHFAGHIIYGIIIGTILGIAKVKFSI